jgi:hypothetical protein
MNTDFDDKLYNKVKRQIAEAIKAPLGQLDFLFDGEELKISPKGLQLSGPFNRIQNIAPTFDLGLSKDEAIFRR